MGQPCKSALIYTKIFRLETPGEFFKGFYIKQNFRQTPSPGVVRGLASPLTVFLHANANCRAHGKYPHETYVLNKNTMCNKTFLDIHKKYKI